MILGFTMLKDRARIYNSNLKNLFFNITVITILVISFALLIIPIIYIKWNSFDVMDLSLYSILIFIPLFIIAILGTNSIIKNDTKRYKKLTYFYIALLFIYIMSLLFVVWESNDYIKYLSKWYGYYSTHNLKDALYGIIDVSNYTPAYNYFLILMAKLGFTDLYGIKLITFLFSLLLAFIITKIISSIKKTNFNYLIFVSILLLPMVLIEYTAWGQCDAIYTSFALLAFYFAINKKSKLCFMFLGISFAFKLQFLFIVPILFVMLIIKDENGDRYLKWKDIWIVPVMYCINLIPAISGRSILDLLTVYINQSTEDNRLAGNCANICQIYMLLDLDNSSIKNVLMISHLALTMIMLFIILFLVFKRYKKYGLTKNDLVFYGMVFAFTMVFFMPKMLDRFFYIALMLSIINVCVNKNKINMLISVFMNFAVYLSVCHSYDLFFNQNVTRTFAIIVNTITLVFIILAIVKNERNKNLKIEEYVND